MYIIGYFCILLMAYDNNFDKYFHPIKNKNYFSSSTATLSYILTGSLQWYNSELVTYFARVKEVSENARVVTGKYTYKFIFNKYNFCLKQTVVDETNN